MVLCGFILSLQGMPFCLLNLLSWFASIEVVSACVCNCSVFPGNREYSGKNAEHCIAVYEYEAKDRTILTELRGSDIKSALCVEVAQVVECEASG